MFRAGAGRGRRWGRLLRVGAPLVGIAAVATGAGVWAKDAGPAQADACFGTAHPVETFAVAMVTHDQSDVYLVAEDRTLTKLSDDLGGFNPEFSPDGRSIAYVSDRDPSNEGINREIWIARCDLDEPQRLIASSGTNDWQLAWSPDGSRVAFTSDRDGFEAIYVADADGTNQRRVSSDGSWGAGAAWSADGTMLAFTSGQLVPGSESDLVVVSASGGPQRRVADVGFNPRWSPDGRTIVFRNPRTLFPSYHAVDADGSNEIVIRNEYDLSPVVLPGYPAWHPYAVTPSGEPLCVRAQDGGEACFSGRDTGWDDISWVFAGVRWSPAVAR